MTGAGIGVWYGGIREADSIITRTGGTASGPIPLMNMVNETGRNVMQGGARRSAIWSGLPWSHPDVREFIRAKDWPQWLRDKKAEDYTTPAPLDMTNISVTLDDAFFAAYADERNPNHDVALSVYKKVVDKMITTGEPGFTIDRGKDAAEVLRNAPVTAATNVLTSQGYKPVSDIVGNPVSIWTGMRWADDIVFEKTKANADIVKVVMTNNKSIRCDPSHEFLVEASGITRVSAGKLKPGNKLHVSAPGATNSSVQVVSVEADGVEDVFCADVKAAEHSFMAEGVIISNCTEITSADDSDVCNLGSLVLSRFQSPEQFGQAVRDACLFLTAGTIYSELPYAKVHDVRDKNRRLGLGIMGIHEFLLQREVRYGTPEAFEVLEPYMAEYGRALEYAVDQQDKLGLSRSVAATAIAPNGTNGIVAETTPSAEPIFSTAEKRGVRVAGPKGDRWEYTYVVDPVAKRLVEQGVDPKLIEDAHTLSYDVERRFAMQEYLQRYTDHAISSTVNLPAPITGETEQQQFGDLLMKYAPDLRGITCYPDGARSGQPKTPVDLEFALAREGTLVEQDEETCVGGVCSL